MYILLSLQQSAAVWICPLQRVLLLQVSLEVSCSLHSLQVVLLELSSVKIRGNLLTSLSTCEPKTLSVKLNAILSVHDIRKIFYCYIYYKSHLCSSNNNDVYEDQHPDMECNPAYVMVNKNSKFADDDFARSIPRCDTYI